MEQLANHILTEIKNNFATYIEKADTDKQVCYGFIVINNDITMEVVERKKTFAECMPLFESYMYKYGLDNFCIGIMKAPYRVKGAKWMFTGEWAYRIADYYLGSMETYSRLRMVGSVSVSSEGELVYVKGRVSGHDYYMDEIAFRHFRDYVCYIPSSGSETDSDSWYTHNMLVDLYDGNEQAAKDLFYRLKGDRPETFVRL